MIICNVLSNRIYRGNESLLSRDLGVNRNTLRKYVDDIGGDHHYVKEDMAGNLELFTNQSSKK